MARNRNRGQNPMTKTAKFAPGGGAQSIIVNKIDVRPIARKGQTIPDWRKAMQSGEGRRPHRTDLYDLYADVVLDGHVEAVTAKRIDAVKAADWQFVDINGDPVEAINQIIDSIGFDDLIDSIMQSKFWGYSIIEPNFRTGFDNRWEMYIYDVPKYNMRPWLGIIAWDSATDDGIDIRSGREAKTIMEVGKINDLGLLLKVAPYQILKRGGWGDYGMFVQVYGQPIADATWDGFNTAHREDLVGILDQLGIQNIVRPTGTDIKLLQTLTGQPGDLHSDFISALDKQISKAIINTTETTEASSSSGFAQAKEHGEQDDVKHESDFNFVRKILNSRFIKILATHGFDVMGGHFEAKPKSKQKTVDDIKIHNDLVTIHKMPIGHDYFYKYYNIPKPDDYDTQIKQMSENLDPEVKAKKKKKSPSEKDTDIDLISEDSFFIKLKDTLKSFFVTAPKNGAIENPCCAPLINLTDDQFKSISANTNELIEAVWSANGKRTLYPIAFTTNAQLLTEAFQTGWTNKSTNKARQKIELLDIGFEYGVDSPDMLSAWEANLFRFSAIRAAYQSEEVNALFREAKSFGEFERLVRETYGVKNSHHLETEYNTAYAVGESAAAYSRLIAIKDLFPYWEYVTIGDEKVRKYHKDLHGKILPAGHVLWALIFPPNDWNCRCFVRPKLKGEINEADVQANIEFVTNYIKNSPAWDRAVQNGFGVNRIDSMEVFTPEQMYSDSPSEVMQQINRMTAKDWGLLDHMSKSTRQPSTDIRSQVIGNELTDYAGRVITVGDGAAIDDIIFDTIQTPDELWFVDIDKGVYTYLMHGVNPQKVVVKLGEDGRGIISNYGIATEADRVGMLIKS